MLHFFPNVTHPVYKIQHKYIICWKSVRNTFKNMFMQLLYNKVSNEKQKDKSMQTY